MRRTEPNCILDELNHTNRELEEFAYIASHDMQEPLRKITTYSDRLSEKYKDKLVVVGFPANNFLFQEPGTNDKIASFCKKNYGVTFPMAAKISVKGAKMAPIYRWLTEKKYNEFEDSRVKWNFQKYLIDETGHLIEIFPPTTPPDSPEIIAALKK